jgi:hypothetical protein
MTTFLINISPQQIYCTQNCAFGYYKTFSGYTLEMWGAKWSNLEQIPYNNTELKSINLELKLTQIILNITDVYFQAKAGPQVSDPTQLIAGPGCAETGGGRR